MVSKEESFVAVEHHPYFQSTLLEQSLVFEEAWTMRILQSLDFVEWVTTDEEGEEPHLTERNLVVIH